MLTIAIEIDVTEAQQGQLRITYLCQADTALPDFIFAAPRVRNGIECSLLTVKNEHDQQIPYVRTADGFRIHAQVARFTFKLQTRYHVCVGIAPTLNFAYPFINEHELFLGNGVLPYPVAKFTDETSIQLTLLGLPDDWLIFSNMQLPTPERSTLRGFFLYASDHLRVFSFSTDACLFQFVVQQDDLDLDTLWDYLSLVLKWMSATLVPYQPSDDIKVLILQAPREFDVIASNQTVALIETMHGGIVSYLPRYPLYLQKLLGYYDYDLFLRDGLVRELFRFYASSDPSSADKSLLYPSLTCDPYVASLLGESLIDYLYRQYVALGLNLSPQSFLQAEVAKPLVEGRVNRMASWFVFDVYLRQHGSSLVACFRQWLHVQAGRPFTELDDFVQVIISITGEPIPYQLQPMLWQRPPDQYQYLVESALTQIGYELTNLNGVLTVTPASESESSISFELPAFQP